MAQRVTRPFDCRRQLPLVIRARAGDAARYDLARLRDVSLEQPQILVIDFFESLGGEAAVFSST